MDWSRSPSVPARPYIPETVPFTDDSIPDGDYSWRDWLWNDLEAPWLLWATLAFFVVIMGAVCWHVAVYG